MTKMNNNSIVIQDILNKAVERFDSIDIIKKVSLSGITNDNTIPIDQLEIYQIKERVFLNKNNASFVLVVIPLSTQVWANVFLDILSTNEFLGYKGIFIDCYSVPNKREKITSLNENISVQSPEEFINDLIGIDDYILSLILAIKSDQIEKEFIPRKSKKIELNKKGEIIDHPITKFEDIFEGWAKKEYNASTNKNLLILGERGAGKTWLLKDFVYSQNEKFIKQPWKFIPAIYINLNDYSKYLNRSKGLHKTLSYFILKDHPSKRNGEIYMWEAFLSTQHTIIVLDGFDEISNEIEDTYELIKDLNNLFNYIPSKCKIILSLRATKFNSIAEIHDLFCLHFKTNTNAVFGTDIFLKSGLSSIDKTKFNIFDIIPFDDKDVKELVKRLISTESQHKSRDLIYNSIENILSNPKKLFINEQLKDIISIPACAKEVLKLLGEKFEDPFQVFEMSIINQLIDINLEEKRATNSFSFIKNNRTIKDFLNSEFYLPDEEKVNFRIDLNSRVKILEGIAWHLIETNRNEFNPELIAYTFLEMPNTQFKAIINDLKSQTVFKNSLNEYKANKIQFRLLSIQAYFASRYIFFSISRDYKNIKYLGRFNFNSPIGKLVAGFLKCLLSSGGIDINEETTRYSLIDIEENVKKISLSELKSLIDKYIQEADRFSPYTKYLRSNIELLDFKELLSVNSEWTFLQSSNQIFSLSHEDIIPRGVIEITKKSEFIKKEIAPFILARREVTNTEFNTFLESDIIPCFIKVKDETKSIYKLSFKKAKNKDLGKNNHPLNWSSIHRGETTLFKLFTNDYHLFYWQDGNFSTEDEFVPVVWISGFVAAIYCNWKTIVSNKQKVVDDDLYYKIKIVDNKPEITINEEPTEYIRFRLPSLFEWLYASRAYAEYEFPWSRYLNSNDPLENRKGENFIAFLIDSRQKPLSAMASIPNEFGIYGLIGNVREWVFPDIDGNKLMGNIMGATPTLGKFTYSFNHLGNQLPLINTNLDVGFRIAASIDKDSYEIIESYLNKNSK